MKIAFDHQIFSLQNYGGISRYIVELSAQLSNIGNEVNILSFFHVNPLFRELLSTHKDISSSYYSKRIPKAIVWGANEFLACISKSISDFDIFHQTYYSLYNNGTRRAKKVLTVHDLIYFKFPQLFGNKNWARAAMARSILSADSLICVSESTKTDLLSLFPVSDKKVHVIHHGKSFGDINPIPTLDLTEPYLLFVGNRQHYKNFECLLTAYARSKKINTNFKLVCFGGGSLLRNEHNVLQRVGLKPDRLVMLSGSDHLLAGLYQDAAAFIYPSLYEGFGMPILEAMELGAPVICSDIAPFKEVAGEAAEYFNPNNCNELQVKIEHVLFDSSKRQLLCELGAKRAQSFSWKKCGLETMSVYEHL